MRLFTRQTGFNTVTYSYWVQFLHWLGELCWNHAEAVVDKHRS